jgi:hypothetical protein
LCRTRLKLSWELDEGKALLTGTPLQNNLHELRALVSVLFQVGRCRLTLSSPR